MFIDHLSLCTRQGLCKIPCGNKEVFSMKKLVALVLSLCLVLAAAPGFALELLSGGDTSVSYTHLDCAPV